ncbi:MAG TPA: DUF3025 domain-containing protein [Polyangiaceae bacterium]|nr:DUF3025 domain-containing protein [Polyangiaceae bacterium]
MGTSVRLKDRVRLAMMSAAFAPDFARQPYRDFHPRFLRAVERRSAWPTPEEYDELALQVPRAGNVQLPRFVSESREAVRQIGGYEQHVARLGAVPTRPGHWHDFFNMAVWAHFPKLRWELNSLHVDPTVGPKDPRNGRAPAQNLAATFDEAGMLVVSTSHALLEELRALRFKQAFWEQREELMSTTRFWVVGHGMLESLLAPHPGLATRSLLLHVPSLPGQRATDEFRFEIDAMAAARVHGWRSGRTVLDPVPVLAIPGYSDNHTRSFYEDMRNIRFEPVSRRPLDIGAG